MAAQNWKYENLKRIAFEHYNTPYLWGGKKPLIGLDCSGFIQDILVAIGLMPKRVMNSNSIFDYFKSQNYPVMSGPPFEGCLVFYGKPSKINHVVYCYAPGLIIGAIGGNSKCKSVQRASLIDARVKALPFNYRKDIVGLINVFEKEREYGDG